MKKIWYYTFPLGLYSITEDGKGICDVSFGKKELSDGLVEEETPLLQKAAQQLSEYFNGQRKSFDLPLSLQGTPFQLADWKALQSIPYGETRTYQEIAIQVGNPKACRAVGMANHRNPVGIIIPCHRVIGKNGKLTGYAGGLGIKEALLLLEQKYSK